MMKRFFGTFPPQCSYSSQPQHIYSTQIAPALPHQLPWNLTLDKCRLFRQAGRKPPEISSETQISFKSLPAIFRVPTVDGWFPPIFHYGYMHDAAKIKRLPIHHAETYPDMRANAFDVQLIIREIVYTGYMMVHNPSCILGPSPSSESESTLSSEGRVAKIDEQELIPKEIGRELEKARLGLVDVYSIATNYYPWIELDRMQKIHELLSPVLGEPRWYVDALSESWNKGPHYDADSQPVEFQPHPFKYYEYTRALRRIIAPLWTPRQRENGVKGSE